MAIPTLLPNYRYEPQQIIFDEAVRDVVDIGVRNFARLMSPKDCPLSARRHIFQFLGCEPLYAAPGIFDDGTYYERVHEYGTMWARAIGTPQAWGHYFTNVLSAPYTYTLRRNPAGRAIGISFFLHPSTPELATLYASADVNNQLRNRSIPYLVANRYVIDRIEFATPHSSTINIMGYSPPTGYAYGEIGDLI